MGRTLSSKVIKGSPEYTVMNGEGVEVARAHCVNVRADLFTLVIGGKWSGVASRDIALSKLTQLVNA